MRPLEIYLPASHASSGDRQYPLLVVLDGESGFQYIVSLLRMMAPNHLPEMIVVGLPNTHRSRDLDLIDPITGADSVDQIRFAQFLGSELIPYIEEKYRALEYRVLAGHSLAGLFTLHLALTSPGLFSGYVATSPSLHDPRRFQGIESALARLEPSALAGSSLFLSVGGEEPPVFQTAVERVATQLEARADLGLTFEWSRFEGEGHVPIRGFYQGLRTLFADWLPSHEALLSGRLPSIRAHYAALTRRFGFAVPVPREILSLTADRRLLRGDAVGAIETYQALLSTYPEDTEAARALNELITEQVELEEYRSQVQDWQERVTVAFPELSGPYLGQGRPGLLPERFASFLLSDADLKHSQLAFGVDGRELFFSTYPGGASPQAILFLEERDGLWTPPQIASFSGTYNEGGPVLDRDARRLYFYSKRPHTPGEPPREEADMWFVERSESDTWGAPQHLGTPPNSEFPDLPYSLAGDNALFHIQLRDRRPYLMRTPPRGSGTELKRLTLDPPFFEPQDMGGDDFFVFEVNEEVEGGRFHSSLFVSYREADGSWTPPRSLGDMINRGEGRFPSFSADGQIFFFTSYRTGLAQHYWVDAAFIDHLRRNDLDLVEQLVEHVVDHGVGGVQQRYRELEARHARYYAFDALLLRDVGNRLQSGGRPKEAQAIRRLNLKLHPNQAHDD